tara:strand:- start:52 stop:291 length:240 start_codon:yes stop_codon:yes gene_type:complete
MIQFLILLQQQVGVLEHQVDVVDPLMVVQVDQVVDQQELEELVEQETLHLYLYLKEILVDRLLPQAILYLELVVGALWQ